MQKQLKMNLRIIFFAFVFLFGSSIDNIANAETKSSESSRFIDNKDGTISDSETGLMWMQNDSYLHSGHWLSWHEAKEYISQLNNANFAHYSDWQLPTARELKTLFDEEKLNSSQVGREMKIHTDPILEKKVADPCGLLMKMADTTLLVLFSIPAVFSAEIKNPALVRPREQLGYTQTNINIF